LRHGILCHPGRHPPEQEALYRQLKVRLAKALLLGLEILVAADIVRTVALEATLPSVAVLGLLVLIRTFILTKSMGNARCGLVRQHEIARQVKVRDWPLGVKAKGATNSLGDTTTCALNTWEGWDPCSGAALFMPFPADRSGQAA